MKPEVSVPELVEVFKEIQNQPEQIFERGWRSWGHGTARSYGKIHHPGNPPKQTIEKEISRDLSLMFLTGISTRSLSMISKRLIGRRSSHTNISSANDDLTEAVEKWRMRDLSKESIKCQLARVLKRPEITRAGQPDSHTEMNRVRK